MKSLLLAPVLAGVVSAAVSYDGYKVFRVPYGDSVDVINGIINSLKLPTWKNSPANGGFADIVVPPEVLDTFQAAAVNLSTIVMHEDLGASIAAESPIQTTAVAVDLTWFNAYHSYADHLTFLSGLQSSFSSNSEVFTIGTSVEGRALTGLHFWGSSGKGVKPAIVLHSTVHAREWITTMVNEYIAYNLITNYATDATIKAYVDKYDFYIIPVVNPDGFAYTQSSDRLWRKNRQTVSSSSCYGRDINRNWPYKWDVSGGASTSPCAEDYKGLAAGDAPENKLLSGHVDSVKAAQGVKLYVDWHSYSQLVMYPYGYSCSATVSKASEYKTLASGVVSAIKALYGTSFTGGPICTTIYQATGTSVDYVSDVTKGDYSFTLELRDTGTYGFVLPASQILPSAKETYAGFEYLLKNMK